MLGHEEDCGQRRALFRSIGKDARAGNGPTRQRLSASKGTPESAGGGRPEFGSLGFGLWDSRFWDSGLGASGRVRNGWASQSEQDDGWFFGSGATRSRVG